MPRRTDRTPRDVNLGSGGRGATRRRANEWMASHTKAEWARRAEEAEAKQYAHMCRDGHAEIAHNDSSDERCPLCRSLDRIAGLKQQVFELRQALIGGAHVIRTGQDTLQWADAADRLLSKGRS